ncbi:28S ribosomal protein S21, mitochondrial-like [Mercenaria mercenaria]|uniref:28S ribosomal protein S21, mitochondrial-like n=1 Tax=Mercenaria mercenaria TaxID=6596 RepID=UPI00234E7766|nr:28S ribosomal protein S21, mitochondrial-like [Mercenaria mercenaria]
MLDNDFLIQNFTEILLTSTMASSRHMKMLARTVLIRNNDLEKSYNILNRILNSEGVLKQDRRLRYFEQPSHARNRVCFERGRRIYDSEMKRKVKFLMKKNRVDPFPR